MQTLAILSKATKQGLSVWRFVQAEDGEYFAFGGVTPACKAFKSLEALRSCYRQWVRYGYEPGITTRKRTVEKQVRAAMTERRTRKPLLVADPWESSLPLSMQMDLDRLSA